MGSSRALLVLRRGHLLHDECSENGWFKSGVRQPKELLAQESGNLGHPPLEVCLVGLPRDPILRQTFRQVAKELGR